ncbi:hypothetical protein EIY72_00205 [Pseudomonas vancouverensis]|uniref:Uncharacterized protein n=1 Tax=Pseudomonas vancouverensis TaxID=95300 RepID=A0A4R4KPC8_PSEVA|nr:hypothetical protein F7R09_01235 [Pseudomonas vancouverensis]TDB68756.1 hypothetical protein EIY72_00205 [Pseudomonas vancouverensis]
MADTALDLRPCAALLWRGSLLPLGCAAAPHPFTEFLQAECIRRFTTAAQPNGSKLPRHK